MLKNTAENDTSGRCTVKWGVCGCGRVAHDFVTAMHSRSQGGRVIAVGDIPQFQENAAKFAKEKGIFRVYSSFEDVGLDPDVDVVYVAVINSLHYDVASMLLRRKKNVLVEKPCALKSAHVRDLIDLARENDCFLMEGIWMRFFPATKGFIGRLEKRGVDSIGYVTASLGFSGCEIPRILDPKLGGGAMLDMGVYLLHLVCLLFGREEPEELLATAKLTSSGVDESTAVTIRYRNGQILQLFATVSHKPLCDAVVVGKDGNIVRLCSPFWCSTKLESSDGVQEFPLPEIPGMLHPNSEGFIYEINGVEAAILKGEKECHSCPLEDSYFVSQLMDKILEKINACVG